MAVLWWRLSDKPVHDADKAVEFVADLGKGMADLGHLLVVHDKAFGLHALHLAPPALDFSRDDEGVFEAAISVSKPIDQGPRAAGSGP